MHKFWVGWRLWWTGLATCTNAVSQRLTWSEYLMEASVQGILQYVLQSDMSCHGSLSELELVVSRWLCGVGDPCGWGCWHFWLQLAQVDHQTKATAKCSYMTRPPPHKYTSDLQKPLPKRTFLLRRCLKWWVPPSNSSTAIPEDTRRWRRHIMQYTHNK